MNRDKIYPGNTFWLHTKEIHEKVRVKKVELPLVYLEGYDKPVGIENLHGILLTPEIIKDYGFKAHLHNLYFDGYKDFALEDSSEYYWVHKNGQQIAEIDYLHELENIERTGNPEGIPQKEWEERKQKKYNK